jgi:hypothetical protein
MSPYLASSIRLLPTTRNAQSASNEDSVDILPGSAMAAALKSMEETRAHKAASAPPKGASRATERAWRVRLEWRLFSYLDDT